MMGRYPARPLEEKEAWMRDRQRRKAEEASGPGPVVLAPRVPAARPEPPKPPARPRQSEPEEGPHPQQMLRIRRVAKILDIDESTVRRWFRRHVVVVQGPQRQTVLIP